MAPEANYDGSSLALESPHSVVDVGRLEGNQDWQRQWPFLKKALHSI